MSLEDVIETVTRVSVWLAAGVTCYAWYVENALLWRWMLFTLVIVTSIAVDTSSCWVPKQPWWAVSKTTLNVATAARLVSWVSWATAVAYTPEPMFEAFWVIGGVFWIINALAVMLYAFNDDFTDLFEAADRDEARAVFRLIIHDVGAGVLVCVLGASLGDVFDGDTDDSHWRSMLSGAIIFQVFYSFWSHWSDIHVEENTRCCDRKMYRVWRCITRFTCFFVLFVIILTRSHEDRVLVDMGIDTMSFVSGVVACSVLALVNVDGVNKIYDV